MTTETPGRIGHTPEAPDVPSPEEQPEQQPEEQTEHTEEKSEPKPEEPEE